MLLPTLSRRIFFPSRFFNEILSAERRYMGRFGSSRKKLEKITEQAEFRRQEKFQIVTLQTEVLFESLRIVSYAHNKVRKQKKELYKQILFCMFSIILFYIYSMYIIGLLLHVAPTYILL